MPGNEVGDRVHDFFGQENLSLGQHHQQIVDGNWPGGINNTLLPGGQLQINASASFNPNLKNYNLQQSDSERTHGGQSLNIPHGLNSMQSTFRSDLGRSHSQSQQQVAGGHMYGHQVFHTRQNEINHLGADPESNKHNLMSRGFSMLDAQVGNDSSTCNKNLMRFDTSKSPGNYNFFGGQQQLGGQHSGMLQSLSRQQSGASDMQQLQQQAMFKQMQEFQRQRQENVNQVTPVASQAMGNRSTLINGIPVHNTADFSWPPEMAATNNNWLQRGASPAMEGPSTRHMISPQHNQALQLMGVVPQQADNSFYGVPVSSTGNLGQYSHLQGVCNNSFSGSQYMTPEQVSKQDTTSTFRQELQAKSMFGHAVGLMRDSENDLENSQQLESSPMQESHERHGFAQVSEKSQEKPATPAAASLNVATLDPTEEKILFGSDDSVWDVFGRSAGTGVGPTSMLDGTDFAFPSMSSGTWSALMQSAVAETSSGDATPHEQWSGLSFHNSEQQTGIRRTAADNSSGRPQSVWLDGNLHNASSLNPTPSPYSGDGGTSTSYGSISGDLKTGLEIRHNQSENLQADSSQRLMQQFSAVGNKWLDRNSQQEGPMQGNNVYGKVSNSSGTGSNVKDTSGSWTYQSSAPSYNNNDQPSNGQHGWNFIDSLSPAGVANSRGHRNDIDRGTLKNMGEGANYSKMGCLPVEREHGGSTIGGLQVNKEDPKVDSASAIPNLNSMKANPENCQQLLHNNHAAFWKHVNPSVSSKESNLPKNTQPTTDVHSYGFAQSGHNGLEKEVVERHEVDDSNKMENSSDSFCSNASQHTSGGAGGRRENVWLNAGDSHRFGSREKSSNQVGQRPPGVRKFHYHPMGDLEVDVDPSHGGKQNISTQSMHQQVSREFEGPEQGHLEQSTFASHIINSSVEADKGHVPALRGQPKGLHVDPSRSMVPAYGRDASASFDGSAGNFSNRPAAPSESMLELFHEADKQREYEPSKNFSSSSCYPTIEMSGTENSDGADRNQQNQSSVSQQFGLQLGPPSQRPFIKDQSISQSPAQQVSSFNSIHMSSGAHLQAANRALSYNIQGNNSTAFNSGFPYPINYLQHQAFTSSSGQLTAHQSPNHSINGSSMQLRQPDASRERKQNLDLASVANVSQSALNNDHFPSAETFQPNSTNKSRTRDFSQEFPLLETMPVSQPSTVAGMFQKGPSVDSSHKMQYNDPSQEQSLGGQVTDFSNSRTQPKNELKRTFSGVQKPDGQHPQRNLSCDTVASESEGGGEAQSMTANMQLYTEAGSSQNPLGASQGRASIVNHLPDSSPSNIATNQRDIEAFGRSLRPNNISQNLSLLHQMQSTRNAEADPSNRSVKRMRGPEPEPVASRGAQQIFNYSTVKDASINHPSAFTKGDPPQISPQMAPSWFDQYGTLKNGQILPVHGAKKSMAVKAMDRSVIAGRSPENSLASGSLDKVNSAANASQPDNIQQSLNPELITRETISSPLLLPQAHDVNLALRINKRKSGTFEMIPWSKEVEQCSRGLQNSSMSEVEWAQATNRLTEKVLDGADMIEDGTPIRRSKRRLVITTQLLQQLLHPPPASVISADATAHYENQVYYISRLALGDTCSSISFRKDSLLSRHRRTMPSEKDKESESFGEDFCKVTENFISRSKKLEEDLLKLEKGVSVLDLRLECQDLEKFSVINRFAKFHSRGQADGLDTSLSTDPNSQKPCPQRYVSAVPMPRNIPDRVPCLSL